MDSSLEELEPASQHELIPRLLDRVHRVLDKHGVAKSRIRFDDSGNAKTESGFGGTLEADTGPGFEPTPRPQLAATVTIAEEDDGRRVARPQAKPHYRRLTLCFGILSVVLLLLLLVRSL